MILKATNNMNGLEAMICDCGANNWDTKECSQENSTAFVCLACGKSEIIKNKLWKLSGLDSSEIETIESLIKGGLK